MKQEVFLTKGNWTPVIANQQKIEGINRHLLQSPKGKILRRIQLQVDVLLKYTKKLNPYGIHVI
jgi:hypothetical protein